MAILEKEFEIRCWYNYLRHLGRKRPHCHTQLYVFLNYVSALLIFTVHLWIQLMKLEKKTFFFASEIPPEAPGLDSYELCVITWPDADENGASLSDYM